MCDHNGCTCQNLILWYGKGDQNIFLETFKTPKFTVHIEEIRGCFPSRRNPLYG